MTAKPAAVQISSLICSVLFLLLTILLIFLCSSCFPSNETARHSLVWWRIIMMMSHMWLIRYAGDVPTEVELYKMVIKNLHAAELTWRYCGHDHDDLSAGVAYGKKITVLYSMCTGGKKTCFPKQIFCSTSGIICEYTHIRIAERQRQQQ